MKKAGRDVGVPAGQEEPDAIPASRAWIVAEKGGGAAQDSPTRLVYHSC